MNPSEQQTREIQYVNRVTNLFLRADGIQAVIVTLMGADPPRIAFEYQTARDYVWGIIEKCQPDYRNTKLKRPLAVKVTKNCPTSPWGLLGHWVTCGALSYALGQYDMTIEYALGVQETACQFQDDDVLVAGALYSFGLSIFCLRHNKTTTHKEISPEAIAKYCRALLLDDKNQPCAREHSGGARALSAGLHELAWKLWECKYQAKGAMRHIITENLMEPINGLARNIDGATNHYFDRICLPRFGQILASWVGYEHFRFTC